jgi:hypothetical protein
MKGRLPWTYLHNLNVSFSPLMVQLSPSSSIIFPALKKGEIRDHRREARAGSEKTSRSRTVFGVMFDGMRFVCKVISEAHSCGVRRFETR